MTSSETFVPGFDASKVFTTVSENRFTVASPWFQNEIVV
jgi:hypothetical protein